MSKQICNIYRCSKKDGMYLYTSKSDELAKVPEQLLEMVGQTKLSMTMLLTEDKQLAMANSKDVLASIAEKGFYLQMPPAEDDERRQVQINDESA